MNCSVKTLSKLSVMQSQPHVHKTNRCPIFRCTQMETEILLVFLFAYENGREKYLELWEVAMGLFSFF